MLHPARLWRRLRSLVSSRRMDVELDEELRFHIDMEIARRVRAGVPEADARLQTLRAFGGLGRHRDDTRDARGVRPMEDALLDLRIGLRMLLRQRTFATVAILTLALGIGGTTALGTGVYRVLLAPLPFPDGDQLVFLWETDTKSGGTRPIASGNFIDLRNRGRSFTHLAAAEPFGLDWIGPDGAETFETALVTADFFRMQALRPLIGRAFLAEEFEEGRDHVVLLTENLWRSRFGADSALIGSTMVLDSIPRVIIGVMPDDALGPFGAAMFAPKIYRNDEINSRTGGYWEVGGRLAAGVTLEQANAELRAVAAQLAEEYPTTNASISFVARPLRDAMVGNAKTPLLVLFGAVVFVMLIACVNVANLQLAEVVRRGREIAIRTTLGAGRSRLVRQLLTESLLLALVGSAAGLALAWFGIAAIRAVSPQNLWRLRDVAFDGTTVVGALVLAGVVTIVIGVVPVFAAGRVQLAESLAAGGREGSMGSRQRRRANRVLVVSEVSLALVLLVAAGLLMRSLAQIGRADRGFETANVHIVTAQLWGYYPTPARRAAFVVDAETRLRALPGVESAGVTSALPLDWPIGLERVRVEIEGRPTMPGTEPLVVRTYAATPGSFDVLGIPLRRGRLLTETDRAGTTPVALVNEAFVRRHFPNEDPIGKRVVLGFQSRPIARDIIGMVGDVRHDGLQVAPAPGIYLPHAQAATGAVHFVLRADGGAVLRRVLRTAFAEMNGAMPLSQITTMDALLARSLQERRFQLGLLSAFSVAALLLAAIGIYGVMSRATSERTHEIGVRMAMGARTGDVRWMLLRAGGALGVTGVLIGLGASLLLTRTMTGMLYGITALDPLTYVAAALVLVLVTLLATLVPAWRASTVTPVVALRAE